MFGRILRWALLAVRASCRQVEIVADSMESIEKLVEALGKSKSRKRDDRNLHANLSEVKSLCSMSCRRVLLWSVVSWNMIRTLLQ